MIDGTYLFDMKTPLGRKQGTATISARGGVAHVDVDAPIVGKMNVEGKALGDSFTVDGTLNLRLMRKVDYSLVGKVEDDILHLSIKSTKGDFELSGTRV